MRVRTAYSYRDDASVPAFDDARPLIVFDGVCVLCTFWARTVIRIDRRERFVFATAQSALGQALYRHYGLDMRRFETNLVIVEGRLHEKSRAVFAVMRALGPPWSALGLLRIVPRALLDPLYDLMARHRYALFGRRDACMVPSERLKARFLD
jgi:predicted DCC family thiol-disulfide oxidoreductase YuxK